MGRGYASNGLRGVRLIRQHRGMPVDIENLRRIPLLAGLDDRELRRLAGSLKERRLSDGEVIVRQGSGGIAFFLLLDGEASVEVGGQERPPLRPGDHIGEMALLDPDADRSATVRAKGDVVLAHMSAWDFKPFILEHPQVAWAMLQTLARWARGG